MVADAVMVDAALHSFHAVCDYVCVDRVEGSGGGGGTERMAILYPLEP
jgi:hypothetical protein